jgi:hypothetical protein
MSGRSSSENAFLTSCTIRVFFPESNHENKSAELAWIEPTNREAAAMSVAIVSFILVLERSEIKHDSPRMNIHHNLLLQPLAALGEFVLHPIRLIPDLNPILFPNIFIDRYRTAAAGMPILPVLLRSRNPITLSRFDIMAVCT